MTMKCHPRSLPWEGDNMQSAALIDSGRRIPSVVVGIAVAALALSPLRGGLAYAQINLGARGVAPEGSVSASPAQERPDSPVEFSGRAGFVTDYIYRGTTLSARQPAVGAAFEAAMSIIYAGLTVASVKLPTQPAAEITMTAGVRPKLGDINFDLSATRYYYPGETVAPGEFAG